MTVDRGGTVALADASQQLNTQFHNEALTA